MKTLDVSIIIVNWNTRDILRDCLRSVYEQTQAITFKVIIVDNASRDGSAEMVKEEFPQAILIENSQNRGFAAANNQAIKTAGGRYVLLLNSDTVVLDNAIAKAVKFADEHPDTAVVGCRVLNRDYTLQRTCFMYPSLLNTFLAATYLYKIFPKSRFFGREQMTWWDYNDVREVEAVCGCFLLARKEAIDQVGRIDEKYYVYGEETDWCFRFKKNGWKIMFTPEPRIIHYGGQTTKQMARKFRWQLEGSKLIFMRLHRSHWEFQLARFFSALFFLLRTPYWLAVGTFHKGKRSKSLETAGTYLIGGLYCLGNWKKLLMNREALKEKF